MVITLRAKDKLSFINDKCVKPTNDFAEAKKWLKIDNMVISWILSSISKEIAEVFFICYHK